MVDLMDDNDPFEEDIVFDQAGLLGGKTSRGRHHHAPTGFIPTFMLFSRTIFLCIAFIGLGLCASISRGPVIKIQEWLGVEEWEALHTFTAHSVGALIGGLIGAKLFDIYNRQFLVFVSLIWVSVSIIVLPFTLPISLWWMRFTLIATSAGIAFLFTGGNVLCLDLWGRQGGGASLQALHFSYALGAFIAPVIIHPFFAGQQMSITSVNASTLLASTSPPLTTPFDSYSAMPFLDEREDSESIMRFPRNFELPRTVHHLEKRSKHHPHPISGLTEEKLLEMTLPVNKSDNATHSEKSVLKTVGKPTKPKPQHTGATVTDEDDTKWKRPAAKKVIHPTAAKTGNADKSNASLGLNDQETKSNSTNATISESTTTASPTKNLDNHAIPTVNKTTEVGSFLTAESPIKTVDQIGYKNKNVPLFSSRILDNMAEGKMSVPVPEPEVLEVKERIKANESVQSVNVTNDQSPGLLQKITHLLKKPGTYSNLTDDNKFIESIALKFKQYGVTKIHLAFICIGVFVFFNSLIFVFILCHNPREPRSKQEEGCLDSAHHSRYTFFVMLFAFYMFTAEALQGSIHHLLSTTSQENGLSILDKGIDGPALFWGLVCLVRFFCISLSGCIRLKPGKLLGVSTFFTVVGAVSLSIGSYNKDDFLWAGIIVSSIGLAPILPTSLLWMAQYMHVTHRMCAIMIVVTSFGNSLTHGVLTHIAANSHLYSYIMVCISLMSVILLTLSWCILYTSKSFSPPSGGGALRRSSIGGGSSLGLSLDPASDGYELARQQDEDDGMELSTGAMMMRQHSIGEFAEHRQLRNQMLHMEEQGLLID